MSRQDIIITKQEQKIIESILLKVKEKIKGKPNTINFTFLHNILNSKERRFLKKIRNIDPLEHGFKGEFFGIRRTPKNLIIIKNQKYTLHNKEILMKERHLPDYVFKKYTKMNRRMYKDIKKKLVILSGYRTPAYQLITFLVFLHKYKFNFKKTIKRVALPGYSEHGCYKKQALDFVTVDGSPVDEVLKFEKTLEYKWLKKHAKEFNFFLSYPRGNKIGISFEPWHWHFEKK